MRMIAVALLVCSTAAAHAETKAWTAAKKVLPAGLSSIGGMNLAVARSSNIYQQVLPMLMAQAGAAKDQLEALKKQCSIDMLDAIDSLAIGMDENQHGTVVIAIKGTTRKDLETCAEKRAISSGKKFLTKTEDGLTLYTGVDGKDVWVKWLATDVVAITTSPDDKAATTKLLAGGATSDKTLKTRLANVKTDAMIWGVITMKQSLEAIHTTMSAAYGSINAASKNLAVNMHLVVENAQAATDAVKILNDQLAEAKQTKQLPVEVTNGVTIKAAGSEIVLTSTFPEKSAFELIGALMAASK